MAAGDSKKLKLLFYLPGLVDGGAERVMAGLASYFAQAGHDVTLMVDFAASDHCPPLHESIKLIQLPAGHGASVRALAKYLATKQPHIALSAIASCNFKLIAASLLARSAKRVKLILTYHGFDEHETGRLSWLGFAGLPVMSRIADRVVAVSDALQSALADRWNANRSKLARIYNPVAIPQTPEGFDLDALDEQRLMDRENIILSVGRLMPGKRFDLLIRAFADLKDQTSRLVILGEGPQRPALESLIEELKLQDRISLPGFTRDTGAYYANAKCFALTSKTESFGLVLVEALAYGLPIVSTDCGGPYEVLEGGTYGSLLPQNPSTNALTKAISQALQTPGDPLPRIKRARQFSFESGAKAYQDLFEQILK